jgi:hypothetical protein
MESRVFVHSSGRDSEVQTGVVLILKLVFLSHLLCSPEVSKLTENQVLHIRLFSEMLGPQTDSDWKAQVLAPYGMLATFSPSVKKA